MPKNMPASQFNRLMLNCWDMEVELSSLKGLTDNPTVKIDGKELTPQDITFSDSRLMWRVNLNSLLDGGSLEYEITIKLRGSKSLNYLPTGNTTNVKMTSDCATPSFCGNFLPTERR